MRLQENPNIFLEKGPVNGVLTATKVLLQSSCGVYRIPTEFLLAILSALTTLSRRSHCTFTAFALR